MAHFLLGLQAAYTHCIQWMVGKGENVGEDNLKSS